MFPKVCTKSLEQKKLQLSESGRIHLAEILLMAASGQLWHENI